MERVTFTWPDQTQTVANVVSDLGTESWTFVSEDRNLHGKIPEQIMRQLNHYEATGFSAGDHYKFQVEFSNGKILGKIFIKEANYGYELYSDGTPKVITITCLL